MEILEETNLRQWLLAFCLKYRKGVHRDADDGNPHPGFGGVTGDRLLLTAVFPIYDLAKSLLTYNGRRVSVEGGPSDLNQEEAELFVAVRDRLARIVMKMNSEKPGTWIINPKIEDWHIGVTPGHDPMEGPVAAIKPTYQLLLIAEEELEGTKWQQYLGDSSIYTDTAIGAGV